jgi:hypothetical protein
VPVETSSEASAEARREIWKLCERLTGKHDGPWAAGRACGHCDLIIATFDRVSRERERLAYERAAKAGGEVRKRLVSDGATIMEIRAIDVVLTVLRALADGVEATRE